MIKEEDDEDLFEDANIIKKKSTDIDGTRYFRFLKLVNKAFFSTPQQITNFRSILEEVIQIEHPHIVKIEQFHEDDLFFYLTLEYFESYDLFDELSALKDLSEN